MARYKKPDVTVVSSKGQIVIPQSIRERLGIAPKTKLLVYDYQDSVIIKKLEIPDVAKELENVYRKVEARIKDREPSEEEIAQIIQEHRSKKRGSQ